MSSQWAGLAPAVNAHIARWNQLHGELTKLERISNKPDGPDITMGQFPATSAWAIFARSWGLPQADGRIVTPVVVSEGASINGREQFTDSRATVQNGFELMAREYQCLVRATTTYVAAPIVDRIVYAAELVEPEPLFPTDLFTQQCLLVFERPLMVPDYHPDSGELVDYLHVGIRALGWYPCTVHTANTDRSAPLGLGRENEAGEMEDSTGRVLRGGPGIMMIAYTTHDDWLASYGREFLKAVSDGLIDADEHISAEAIKDAIAGRGALFPPRFMPGVAHDALLPSDVMPWRFGTPWFIGERPEYEPGKIDNAVAYVRRFLLSLMRFTWQDLIAVDRVEPSKKLARRMAEAKAPQRDFTVLRLRRRRYDHAENETGTGTPLGYRVKVIAHWRRQYFPSLGPARTDEGDWNPESHRLVWIDEHWRGPEDGPLGPLDHAAVIVR